MKRYYLLSLGLVVILAIVLIACSSDKTITNTITEIQSQTITETRTLTQTTINTQTIEKAIPSSFNTYTDVASYFSISYPSDWITFPSSLEFFGISVKDFFNYYNADVMLEGYIFLFTAISPEELGESRANVNIVVQSVSEVVAKGWLTLDEIVEGKLQRTAEISDGYHEYSRIKLILAEEKPL